METINKIIATLKVFTDEEIDKLKLYIDKETMFRTANFCYHIKKYE